ncbi:Protein of unknown function [Cotesia congregata]|uniref:Uncharacterized protein n=1 Tax=Cotesia congregata TaxID=51543 RepID=A0A8J2HCZ2_COTCN|nr:Protein of unknown function [Cotesia congregata]
MSLGLGKEFNSKAEFDHACKKYYEETGRKFTFSCNYIDTRNLKKVIKNRNLEIYYCLARCRHHREPKVLKKRVHDCLLIAGGTRIIENSQVDNWLSYICDPLKNPNNLTTLKELLNTILSCLLIAGGTRIIENSQVDNWLSYICDPLKNPNNLTTLKELLNTSLSKNWLMT